MIWSRRGRRIAPIALLVSVFGLGLAIAAFLSQGQRSVPDAPVRVAAASEITRVPTAITVTMQEGMDRLRQRAQRGHPCSPPEVSTMGCPGSTPLRPVTIYLVRDEAERLHAFIGEDPRNSCVLILRSDVPRAIFYDPCHGSLYDRYGVVVGGPSPWNLNELSSEVRDGGLYLNPTRFVTGGCPGCP